MCVFLIFMLPSLFMVCTAGDLYSDAVKNFDTETFKKNIGGNIPYFVNFFAPWCGFCKRLTPVWNELAEKYNNVESVFQKIVIAKVDCTIETPLCAEQGISGYPSLVYYSPHATEGIKYKGKRELLALEEFIDLSVGGVADEEEIEMMGLPLPDDSKGAMELTDNLFHKVVDWGLHFVLFYTADCSECQILAPVWEEFARGIKKPVAVSKIDCSVHRSACEEYNIKSFPTVLCIYNGKKVETYHRDHTLKDLKLFVEAMKQVITTIMDNEEGRVPEEAAAKSTELTVHLTISNFNNAVTSGVTFVKFFAPWCGHCRRLAPTWEELARKFAVSKVVKVAKVDCTTDNDLCNLYKVQGYPTLLLFREGTIIGEYKDNRDLESLHTYVVKKLKHDEL